MRLGLTSLALTGAVAAFVGNSGPVVAADPGAISTELAEPPVEIYSRVARGALRCWFGAQGSLKKTYVFHADVAPQTSGGGAEIAIYERDTTGQSPRSVRAFRISIAPTGGGSRLQSDNFRMAPEVARDMGADLGRWVQGQDKCSVVGIGGWKAEHAPPIETSSVAAPPPKKKKSKIATPKAATVPEPNTASEPGTASADAKSAAPATKAAQPAPAGK